MPGIFHAGRVHGEGPLLRQVLWTVDVGQEFVIPASVSFVSVWGIRRGDKRHFLGQG